MVRAILAGTKTQTRRIFTPRVRLRGTVRADYADLLPEAAGYEARAASSLPAQMNQHGAVSVLAENGRYLGVKPGEFDFVCPYATGRTYLDGGWRIDIENGSRLWVKETHALDTWWPESGEANILFRATDPRMGEAPEHIVQLNEAGVDWASRQHKKQTHGIPIWSPSIFMPRWASRITLNVTNVRVERLDAITEEDAKAEGVTPFPKDPEGDCWTDGKHRTAYEYLWGEINGWAGPKSFNENPWVWVVSFERVEAKSEAAE